MGDDPEGAGVTRTVVMQITRLEAGHLADLVEQFRDLLASAGDGAATPEDPAIARLVPVAYADDEEAADQFRALTGRDLLGRRDADALTVLGALGDEGDDGDGLEVMVVTLTPEEVEAWLRTLTALRLVLASRLGIRSESDHDDADPRFGVYEWLAYRLEGLIEASDPG